MTLLDTGESEETHQVMIGFATAQRERSDTEFTHTYET